MSFCVDLWNGFDIIKERFISTRRHIKHFNKLLNAYVCIEKEYCKNLDYIYKEFKDTGNIEYPLEASRISIINMIDFESKCRKEYINYVNKNIIGKISIYLAEPKISLDQSFLDSIELTQSFNKSFEKLVGKQEAFFSQCKELSSYISQLVLDNNLNNKSSMVKCNKKCSQLIKARDDYILYLNETNIERNKFNCKMEDLLNDLEKTYRRTNDLFKDYLSDFGEQKYQLLKVLFEKEKSDYEKYHSNIDIDKEELLFILKNATKDFPKIKLDFCPLKSNGIGKFIKSKYRDKLNDKEYNEIIKEIQKYLKEKDVFPDNLIQTGISKISQKKEFDFFSVRRFTKTREKHNLIEPLENRLNTIEDKIRDKTPAEKEEIILENIKFIKNFINDLVTKGKIKLYEDKIIKNENTYFLDETKDKKVEMNEAQKVEEFYNLISQSNESSELYIETFIKVLSFLRSKGYFEIGQYNYNLFLKAFVNILNENPKNDYILKNILILSQTFYYIDQDEKIYLQNGLRGIEVLNCAETWHRCINYTINLANTEKDLTIPINRTDFINKINKEAFVIVVSYLCDLQLFTDNKDIYEKVKYFYLQLYNLNENTVNDSIEEYKKSLNKKIQKNNIKDINTPEIKNWTSKNKIEDTKAKTEDTKIRVKKIEKLKEKKHEVNEFNIKEDFREKEDKEKNGESNNNDKDKIKNDNKD